MRLIYHPEAEVELIDAARFYERRVRTLGVQFIGVADQAVRTILDSPERWRIVEADVRRYLMPLFPSNGHQDHCVIESRVA
jgi:toxin ParE1/3/4